MPGRFAVKLCSVNKSPVFMGRLATIDLRAIGKLVNSLGIKRFIPSPSAFSMLRIPSIIALSSAGSRLALWSGPGRDLSVVKCFSIIVAPNATAAIGISPMEWHKLLGSKANRDYLADELIDES